MVAVVGANQHTFLCLDYILLMISTKVALK